MKANKIITVLGFAATLSLVLVGCGSNTSTSSKTTTNQSATTKTTTTSDITLDDAKKIATEAAGVSEADITYTTLKQEMEDGQLVYNIEFYDSAKEYDYEILTSSGKIISSDIDANEYANDAAVNADITKEKATSIALEKVPGASEKNIRIHLTVDDGQPIYEGDIVYNDVKYDFEINAMNGTVYEWETEAVTI